MYDSSEELADYGRIRFAVPAELLELLFDLVLELFELISTGPSKELELLELTACCLVGKFDARTDTPRLSSAKSGKSDNGGVFNIKFVSILYDGALFADSNTDSFVRSIALFEKDWHPSQGQQEALLAEVTL